ncbi:MAG TPA: HmuY family protein [Gemmatimonadaceae bacterium]|jgi:hypothetical protein
MLASRIQSGLLIGSAALLAACSDSSSTTEPGSQYTTIQLNAATAPAYLTLGSPATVATVTDPATSSAWDLSFSSAPNVTVNGGASGPGGVKAYCLCANGALTLTQVEALTTTQGADAFGAVTTTSIPTDSTKFQADAATQAISGWYDYNTTSHQLSANATVWAVKLVTTAGSYAKFHVKTIAADGSSAALEWATQVGGTAATSTTNQTVTVNPGSTTKIYVNLTTGATSTTAPASWDLAIANYTIYVNGIGGASAIQLVPSPYASYAAITQMPIGGTTGIPASVFATDGAGGVFSTNAPYRYDSNSHQVYPSYDVYLVKKGTAVYKVQVTNYYNTTGTFGNITVRYAKIGG